MKDGSFACERHIDADKIAASVSSLHRQQRPWCEFQSSAPSETTGGGSGDGGGDGDGMAVDEETTGKLRLKWCSSCRCEQPIEMFKKGGATCSRCLGRKRRKRNETVTENPVLSNSALIQY